jgi:hypothetical protein
VKKNILAIESSNHDKRSFLLVPKFWCLNGLK